MEKKLQILDRGEVAGGVHLFEVRINDSKVASFEDDPNCSPAEIMESAVAAAKKEGVEL